MAPRISDPRMNPPKDRSALCCSSSASLPSSGGSARVNRRHIVFPSLRMRKAMMRTSVTLKKIVAVADTTTIFFNVTLVLIIAFLILNDGNTMWRRFTRALPPELGSEAELLQQSADRSFGGFIRGSLILGAIYGIATLAILVALGVPFAGVLAVLSGLTMI